MNYPKRKQLRLPDYDYSTPGAYFVTVCTEDKSCILSHIRVGEGLAPPENLLTAFGRIAEEQLFDLQRRFPSLTVDKFVIMPNHVHILLTLRENAGGASPSPTLFDVMRVYKSMTTRLSKQRQPELRLWQRSYHEHVIRDEADYLQIWNYIDTNPAKWTEDRYWAE